LDHSVQLQVAFVP